MTATGAPQPLAALRDDLVLSEGQAEGAGEAAWRVYDPLRHKFISIDHATAIVLALWRECKTAADLAAKAQQRLGRPVAATEIEALAVFLRQNGLTTPLADEDWRKSLVPPTGKAGNMLMRAVHSYLFFKIPLFAPEPFLRAAWPWVAPLFTRAALVAIALTGLIGLYLVSRQWSLFLDDARGLMTAAGLAQFGATLFVVKIFHEFGHAFVAHRAGCSVPVMGIAVMMGAPVLYTDVTDAWRLSDKRQRLMIDAAGVAVELGIACIATFLWVFLPEGAPRQVAFLLATSSWLMSIAINLNPFMRFDGYYILADVMGIENLQERAFAFGTWRLRETLFGLRANAPEALPQRTTWFLVGYAWCVWVYRVILFTGIALAVYAFFFKALGIAMFLFEIGYFIAKPVWAELKSWWAVRQLILATSRTWRTGLVLGVGMLAFVLPWSTQVSVPAVVDAAETTAIHVPRPARLVRVIVAPQSAVTKGGLIAEFEAPELDHEIRTVQARLGATHVRLNRGAADREDREERIVLETTRASLESRLAGLFKEKRELSLRAPLDGIVADLNPRLLAGRWIAPKEQVALLRSNVGATVRGFVPEGQAWRIGPGHTARFTPDAATGERFKAAIVSVSMVAAPFIDALELTQTNGGPIDSTTDERRRARPTTAHFAVTAAPLDTSRMTETRLRGTLHVSGIAESFATATFRRILQVLVREAGT